MPITRQDAWSQDEDLLLAETVLRHIREGGTQLKAFDEVGKKLSRTGAACGFRWNSFVRKQYESGIELAKQQRKELKKQSKKAAAEIDDVAAIPQTEEASQPEETDKLSFNVIMSYLEDLYKKAERAQHQELNIETYTEKIKDLEGQIYYLSDENKKIVAELKAIESDHRALLEIMERARKMVTIKET